MHGCARRSVGGGGGGRGDSKQPQIRLNHWQMLEGCHEPSQEDKSKTGLQQRRETGTCTNARAFIYLWPWQDSNVSEMSQESNRLSTVLRRYSKGAPYLHWIFLCEAHSVCCLHCTKVILVKSDREIRQFSKAIWFLLLLFEYVRIFLWPSQTPIYHS